MGGELLFVCGPLFLRFGGLLSEVRAVAERVVPRLTASAEGYAVPPLIDIAIR